MLKGNHLDFINIDKDGERTSYRTALFRGENLPSIGVVDCEGHPIYEGDTVSVFIESEPGIFRSSVHKVKWYGDQGYPGFDFDPPLKESNVNGFLVADKIRILERAGS
jgi:hypothetical protein